MSTAPFKSGFIAIFGRPNAGKSTLMNKILGTRVAAVSPLPQTTRERLAGIFSDERRQIVFVDLPGLINKEDRLNLCLRQNAIDGLEGVDAVLHLVDVEDEEAFSEDVLKTLQAVNVPLILAVNKLDGKRARGNAGSWVGEKCPPEVKRRYRTILGISAKEGTGVPELLAAIDPFLPAGEAMYDPESLTDRDMRYLSQEAIREKVFLLLREELPYSTAVLIDEFEERDGGKWYIRATIFVERDSQKGIVLGKGGDMLRRISTAARLEIEALCDAPVFLDLWVKVREKWTRNDASLREFGYLDPAARRRNRRHR